MKPRPQRERLQSEEASGHGRRCRAPAATRPLHWLATRPPFPLLGASAAACGPWRGCASWAASRRRRCARVRALVWGRRGGCRAAVPRRALRSCPVALLPPPGWVARGGGALAGLLQQARCRRPPLHPRATPATCADPKVLAFYRALRERQLRALGLDPAEFKTVY